MKKLLFVILLSGISLSINAGEAAQDARISKLEKEVDRISEVLRRDARKKEYDIWADKASMYDLGNNPKEKAHILRNR